ncbi:MAG: hypothetical protein JWO38_3763 [Gemmataceae bacterium]|nr:hypothetical protein [Gemmataceae bacterium]
MNLNVTSATQSGSQITVTGVAAAGATVQILSGTTVIATVTADPVTGNFTAVFTAPSSTTGLVASTAGRKSVPIVVSAAAASATAAGAT